MDFFRGRLVSIVTRHRKEQVIGPALEKIPGLQWKAVNDIDTDVLGTFTGEIPREGTQREACIKKIGLLASTPGHDLVLASEGAFGPHPAIPFAQADIELLMLFDPIQNFYWEAWEVSAETTAFSSTFASPGEALEEALKHGFPLQGMVVLWEDHNKQVHIHKGIHDEKELLEAAARALLGANLPKLEADLRAMHHPARMRVIEKAASKLVAMLIKNCPQCAFPGYGITETAPGLPCEWCGTPTEGTLYCIHCCKKCGLQEKIRNEKQAMEPMYCSSCNP